MVTIKDCAVLSHEIYDRPNAGTPTWRPERIMKQPGSGFMGGVYRSSTSKEVIVCYRGSDEFIDAVADSAFRPDVTRWIPSKGLLQTAMRTLETQISTGYNLYLWAKSKFRRAAPR